jgi:hypothetical protein
MRRMHVEQKIGAVAVDLVIEIDLQFEADHELRSAASATRFALAVDARVFHRVREAIVDEALVGVLRLLALQDAVFLHLRTLFLGLLLFGLLFHVNSPVFVCGMGVDAMPLNAAQLEWWERWPEVRAVSALRPRSGRA